MTNIGDDEYDGRWGPVASENGVEYIYNNETNTFMLVSNMTDDDLIEALMCGSMDATDVRAYIREPRMLRELITGEAPDEPAPDVESVVDDAAGLEDFATINAIVVKQLADHKEDLETLAELQSGKDYVASLKRGSGRGNNGYTGRLVVNGEVLQEGTPEPQIVGTPKCKAEPCLNFASENTAYDGCCSAGCLSKVRAEAYKASKEYQDWIQSKLCLGAGCSNLTDGSDYCSWDCVPWDTLVDADPGKRTAEQQTPTIGHTTVTPPATRTTADGVKVTQLQATGTCKQCGGELPASRAYYCFKCSEPSLAANTYTPSGGYTSGYTSGYSKYVPLCEHWRAPFRLLHGLTVYLSSSRDEPTDKFPALKRPGFEGQPDVGVYFDEWSWRPVGAVRTTGFDIPGLAPQAGKVVTVPWPDMGTPGCSIGDFRTIVRWVLGQLQQGKTVDIGCIGAHGRTGTFVACLLTEQGMPSRQAIAQVRKEHCDLAIETSEQTEYIHKFGKRRLPPGATGHGPYGPGGKKRGKPQRLKQRGLRKGAAATVEAMDSAGVPIGS